MKKFALLMAAVAGVAGFAGTTSANIHFELQATGVTGAGSSLTDSHDVVVATGSVVSFNIVAIITNTAGTGDGVQSGEATLEGAGSDSQFTGTIADSLSSPFNGSGSNAGATTNATNKQIAYIGGSLTPADGGAGNFVFRDGSEDVNGETYIIGTGTYTVTGSSGSDSALLSYINATTTSTNRNPLWQENSVPKSASTGTIGSSVGINLTEAVSEVPEPASLGILALGGLALMAGRRRRA